MAAKKQQQTFVDKALMRKRSNAAKKAWETRRLADLEAKLQQEVQSAKKKLQAATQKKKSTKKPSK